MDLSTYKYGAVVTYQCEICGKTATKQLRKKTDFIFKCKKCLLNIVHRNYTDQQKASILEKAKQTSLQKYGTEFPSQAIQTKDACKKTCLEKYGVDNVSKVEQIKRKIKENAQKTCQERYNVNSPFQCKEIYEKRNKTMIKKYGFSVPVKNEEIKRKQFQTNLKKYGTKSSLSNKQVREKIKKTFQDIYGGWNSISPIVQEKRKQTCLEKYGVDHPWKNKQIREKGKKTCLEKYGVDNGAFLLRNGWHYCYNNEKLDSMWELAVYIYYLDNQIYIERNKQAIILKNGSKFYPDFKIKTGFLEIKSNFWKSQKTQNWSFKKQKCEEQNIQIIDDSNVNFYMNYIKTRYGSLSYLKEFRRKYEN